MIFAKNFARNLKKIILGTSDACSMGQRPSEPAYYIEDCRISESFGQKAGRFFSCSAFYQQKYMLWLNHSKEHCY